jgi:hypothetical protein
MKGYGLPEVVVHDVVARSQVQADAARLEGQNEDLRRGVGLELVHCFVAVGFGHGPLRRAEWGRSASACCVPTRLKSGIFAPFRPTLKALERSTGRLEARVWREIRPCEIIQDGNGQTWTPERFKRPS